MNLITGELEARIAAPVASLPRVAAPRARQRARRLPVFVGERARLRGDSRAPGCRAVAAGARSRAAAPAARWI